MRRMHRSGGIHEDPRFLQGVELFNAREFFEASDLFEELFFEAIVGELEFVRAFLQLSVGCVHAERRQARAAIERLREGLLAIDRVTDHRGYDFPALRANTARIIELLEASSISASDWPQILRC